MDKSNTTLVSRIINDAHHKPDILDTIANLSNDEVFTPPSVANRILDTLELAEPNIYKNKNLTFYDPGVKTGIFLRELATRLMKGLSDTIPDETDRRDWILGRMLYGTAITELTSLIARRTLYTAKNANSELSIAKGVFQTERGNIDYENRPHTFIGNNCKYCGLSKNERTLGERRSDKERYAYKFIHLSPEEAEHMKFDVIVGNPPYQLNDGGNSASASPIYQMFVDQAISLAPRYISFIIPSRWFAGGKGLDQFRRKMLNDKHIRVIYDYPDANDCFPGVLIAGGVMYFVWDSSYSGNCEIHTLIGNDELPVACRPLNEFDVFIRENQAVSILRKVRKRHESTLDNVISPRRPFGLPTNFKDFNTRESPDKYKIYSSSQTGDRRISYVDKQLITRGYEYIDKWKVLMPKAYRIGSSKDGGYINAIVAEPDSVCTETFLVIKSFDNKEQANNLVKYIKTRFFRFLVSLRKITQDATAKVYGFVPDLPMDREWTDEKLYERYNITPKERAFIESEIREMR